MATFVSLQRRSTNPAQPDLATGVLDRRKPASPKTTGNPASQDDQRTPEARSTSLDWNFARISVRPSAAPAIQTKLKVNQPGDQYEQEADHIADQVVSMPAPSASVPVKGSANARIQRACACGGACDKCKDDEHHHLQRKPASSANAAPATAPPTVSDVLSSPGQPLDSATRAFMEPRFGYDFSGVRIHAGDKAAASAQALRASAYTVGRHIVFGNREFSSEDPDARQLVAHELTHVIQQQGAFASPAMVMRAPEDKDPKPKQPAPPTPPPPPAPATCAINCTDPAFLTLSPDDRAKQFDTQCPKGYPLDTTFFGQAIPGATSKKLHDKLLAAVSRAKRLMCINGKDPAAYTLDRRIGTYARHSPSESRAVDIDTEGQTYVLHEAYAHKEDVENQLTPVYNRIAYWSLGAKSIIPSAIKTIDRPEKSSPDARTWRNPETGKTESITTGQLYDKYKAESDAMTQYFELLLKSDADLQTLMQAFVDQHKTDPDPAKKLSLPAAATPADLTKFRQRIADDYRLLGGSKAQLKSFAGQPVANISHAPPTVKEGDKDVELNRPFRNGAVAGSMSGGNPDPAANRRPELGFVTLPREVVVALTQENLAWGGVDFGGEAGDIMHFDCRFGAC